MSILTSKEKFDLAMKEESRYAKLEMNAVARNDHADAERCNKMRWRMMDKAIQFLEEGREKP